VAGGGDAGEVSMRGLRERRGARFRAGVLIEATTRRQGGGRRFSAAMFRAGDGERWPAVTRGCSCNSVKARRRGDAEETKRKMTDGGAHR
jgi:hypothetical protein